MTAQLDLLSSLEPVPARSEPSGKQHAAVLVALYEAGNRGMTGEEVAVYCRFRAAHIASTRLIELADRDRYPVPLVFRNGAKRATASGRRAAVWLLTDAGRDVARGLK